MMVVNCGMCREGLIDVVFCHISTNWFKVI